MFFKTEFMQIQMFKYQFHCARTYVIKGKPYYIVFEHATISRYLVRRIGINFITFVTFPCDMVKTFDLS